MDAPSGAVGLDPMPQGAEREAIRLAVHKRDVAMPLLEVSLFSNPTARAAWEAIAAAPGVRVIDDVDAEIPQYPTPLDATNGDDCLVGRLRRDLVFAEKGLTFWVVGDQVRKGAALNAVQIAELL